MTGDLVGVVIITADDTATGTLTAHDVLIPDDPLPATCWRHYARLTDGARHDLARPPRHWGY